MSSPQKSEHDISEDATLHKAKQKFLEHLAEVDTSEGTATTLVLKFRLAPEVLSELDTFVNQHGCAMNSRVITREEQDKIDKRVKSCSQFTYFEVTSEAQENYLKSTGKTRVPKKASPKKAETPAKPTKKAEKTATPAKKTATPAKKTTTPAKKAITPAKIPRSGPKQKTDIPESEDDAVPETDGVVSIPIGQFDDLSARLASALLLLPTTDHTRSVECRDTLLDVAHEMRQLRPLKRALDEDEGEGEGGSSAKKQRT
ncbi:hypothetical protein K438DRAFT_1851151 [Mycena galopus ATCC 62051]|nr:hypothetical protein K438DRAFT_1851151 [Mycena galopus ATCC 62051]